MQRAFDVSRRWFAALLACASVLFVGQSVALADESSGTWTGELESHGSYYLERSTKVLVPTGRLLLEAPNGVRMNVAYLADVISSASIGQMGSDIDSVHVEVRQGVAAGAGKTLAVGDNEISVGVSATHSWESDYISWLGGINAGYLFNQKNTGLSLGISGVHDSIYQNMNMGMTRDFVGHLDGVTTNLGFTQVVSPVLTFGAGYQFVYLTGFLGNPYRRVAIGPGQPERPPETRLRHNLELTAAWYLPSTATTLQGFARLYTDSWNLNAITPELRVYQQLGRDFNVRLRARYYLQGKADFAQPAASIGVYPVGYTGPATSDPKLTEFDSIQLGIRISMAMTAFEHTFMSWASRGVLDLSFDHTWTTVASTSFGNKNLFLILGGRLPF
ncbi:MAG TPA: DUF3570 domain-containing protein [Polyangiales bacterium]|nr:DUF3570 domain-containing protein [Polyangiales bacterium]